MLNFKRLKQQVSLECVLEHYEVLGHLNQSGKSLRGSCPFCKASDDNPFSVSLEKNAFQCFACKASGNIFDFVALSEGIDISNGIRPAAEFVERTFSPKLKEKVERKKDVDLSVTRNDEQAGSINQPLTFALKGIDPTHRFTEVLGISEKIATAFGAGFYSGRGMFKNHFVLPISNAEGELIAYSGIPTEGKSIPLYPPKFTKEFALFNLNAASMEADRNDYGLILVRDPLQVMVLAEAGYGNCIAYIGDTIAQSQCHLLLRTLGAGAKMSLLACDDDEHVAENLNSMLPLFFVHLVRFKRNKTLPVGFTINEITALLPML